MDQSIARNDGSGSRGRPQPDPLLTSDKRSVSEVEVVTEHVPLVLGGEHGGSVEAALEDRAQGFVATRRTIETFPDPRATGMLPADVAPQIPFLGGRR